MDKPAITGKAFEFHSGDREDIENPFYTMIAPCKVPLAFFAIRAF